MKTPFVWLGSKRAAKRGVGEKGALLDQAARARLPVPNGGIVLHEFYQLLLVEDIIQETNGRVTVANPVEVFEALYTAARFPRLSTKTAFRAAFSLLVDPQEPVIVPTTAVLHVDADDAVSLVDALCTVWSVALAHPASLRRDVIVQEMVTTAVAGTATIAAEQDRDHVTVTGGAGEQSLMLPHLSWWQRPSSERPSYARRLQQLLRGVRRTFGHEKWLLTWVDDGHICWLLQIERLS